MKNLINEILNSFDNSVNVINESKILAEKIQLTVTTITQCITKGNKVIIFGNGGSAADSQHMAAELIGRYLRERKSIPAIALTTDTSILTAIGNDYGFDMVFSRQCESLVKKGDVVIAISTSGNSQNVIKGVQIAKKRGSKIIVLSGNKSGKLLKLADIKLQVPSKEIPTIQEGHRVIIHIICELVERHFTRK